MKPVGGVLLNPDKIDGKADINEEKVA